MSLLPNAMRIRDDFDKIFGDVKKPAPLVTPTPDQPKHDLHNLTPSDKAGLPKELLDLMELVERAS